MVQERLTRMFAKLPYSQWLDSLGLPVYRGHHVEDLRTVDLGWWDLMGCNVGFLQLFGMEGISEGRIVEIPPGGSSKPIKPTLGEIVYVISGHGLASVWSGDGPKVNFEWQAHAMFHIPRHAQFQLSNARGDQPARLLHYNYIPLAMTVLPDPDYFFNNVHDQPDLVYGSGDDLYSSATAVLGRGAADANAQAWGAKRDDNVDAAAHGGVYWSGNFFPDMASWDRLSPWQSRGAGGTNVQIVFPGSGMRASMSVFDPLKYKKAHLHGPGRVIVIPKGEGYSILWQPGKEDERVVCPWGEGSVFTPPGNWLHQHFNTGAEPARYLKFSHLPQFSGAEYNQQIEYAEEPSWIRDQFASELAARSLSTQMPEEAYADPNYVWNYGDDS